MSNDINIEKIEFNGDQARCIFSFCRKIRTDGYFSEIDLKREIVSLIAKEWVKENGTDMMELIERDRLSSSVILQLSKAILEKNLPTK